MDGWSVSTAAAATLETLQDGGRPTIQSDHAQGCIGKEFARTLAESGV